MNHELLDYVMSRRVGETRPFIGQVVEVTRSVCAKDGVNVRYRLNDGAGSRVARSPIELVSASGPCRIVSDQEATAVFEAVKVYRQHIADVAAEERQPA